MVNIEPIRVEVEREDDGRILASVPELPGVMAYDAVEEEAVRKVKSIATQELACMIESGEDVPELLRVLFAASVSGGDERLAIRRRDAPPRLATEETSIK